MEHRMKTFWMVIVAAMLFGGSLAQAAGPVTARAGKYTVELSSQPSPPTVGENLLVITVKDGEKPLTGAGVDVHVDMTSMPMPADAKAAPGRVEGQYGATVNLSMAGTWKVDIVVAQMAGMAMDGDGTAHFIIDTGKGITGKNGGVSLPWFGIVVVLVLGAAVLTAIFYRRIPPRQRGYLVGTLTLLVVLVGTIAVVRKYRDPKTSTVIASANMDMSTQAAPGTVAVATETARRAPFQASATYTGSVVPDLEEDVYPRVTGRLVLMPFYPGEQVGRGAVVARLDSTELAAKEAQALYGNMGANQEITAANADTASAQAGQVKSRRAVDQARAQLTQVQAAARAAGGAVKAAQSDVENARQMANEAESAVQASQSGIDQATEGVVQAQSDVDSARADVEYWTTEIAREKKLYEQGAIAKEELDRETAQAAATQAKLKQVDAGVRTAEAGVTKAKREYAQAQARQAAAQAGIATAEARLEQAQADRDSAQGRITEAEAGIAIAMADVDAAAAGVTGASAKARVATTTALQARAALTEASTVRGYTTIRSAVGGIVTARNISPGVLVQPGMSILKIAKIDAVRIQVNVSEADLAQIRLGQLLTAHAVDAPERAISARISAIFPARDTTARTSIVEARVANPGYLLKPGQYLSVQVNLGGDSRPAITVPTNAIITRDGQSSVFLAANDGMRTVARRVAVTTGRMSNDRTEIQTGVSVGDEVVTSGLANLRDGDAVTVVQQATQPLPDAAAPARNPGTPVTGTGEAADSAAPMEMAPVRATDPAAMPSSSRETSGAATGQPTADAKKWYHCPMHVDMESPRPGKCPKCGMDYVVFDKK